MTIFIDTFLKTMPCLNTLGTLTYFSLKTHELGTITTYLWMAIWELEIFK